MLAETISGFSNVYKLKAWKTFFKLNKVIS